MKKVHLFALALIAGQTTFAQTITTIAGTGTAGYSGDGGMATAAQLTSPGDIIFDRGGDIIFSDYYNNRIRKIDHSGNISTIAGNGSPTYSGDGGLATAASLFHPCGIAFDQFNELIIADDANNVIRKIDTLGFIHTIAGNGSRSYSGDGGPAALATLNNPARLSFDAHWNLYIADQDNNCIRKIDTLGNISTFAGTSSPGFSGDGGLATAAEINGPTDVSVDVSGNVYICDQFNQRIRKVDLSGKIYTIAGDGYAGYGGDGGPATAAEFFYPSSVTTDALGNVYIDDSYNDAIRKIDATGTMTTVAGNGTSGFSGDGGAATSAQLSNPWEVTVDQCGDLFISDADNGAIRKVTFSSIIPPITGPASVDVDSAITLTDVVAGGTWSITPTTVATVDPTSGTVTGIAEGTAYVTFSGECGVTVDTITVLPHSDGTSLSVGTVDNSDIFELTPNPNNGKFTVSGRATVTSGTEISVNVLDVTGKVITHRSASIDNGSFSTTIELTNTTPGIYFVQAVGNKYYHILRTSIIK